MKKIILATLILIFTCQVSFADDIAKKEAACELKLKEEASLLPETALIANSQEIPQEETDNIFTNDPQSETELQGYLEYDESPDETIYLDQQPESTQNTVYLKAPTDSNSLKLKTPTKVGSKSLGSATTKQIQMTNTKRMDSAASMFSSQEYNITPVSSAYTVKKGSVSFGTTYNSGLDSAQSSYSTGFFTKYDDKHYSLTTGFTRGTNNSYAAYSDRMFFAPELKLTKRLSLLDVIQTDMLQVNRKNEVVLRYTPHFKKYADEVQFELGAGQSFYEENFVNSSVRFSTRFRL